MRDLSAKLHLSFKQALCDYVLELFLLPQPIAQLSDTLSPQTSPVRKLAGSPYSILEPSPTDLSLCHEPSERDSPWRVLTEKGEMHVPSTLPFKTQISHESQVSLDTPNITEPKRSRADTATIRQEMKEILHSTDTAGKSERAREDKKGEREKAEEGEKEEEPSSLTWHEKERIRREEEARSAYHREAHYGKMGILESTYSTVIPKHFSQMLKISSHSVVHHTFPTLGNYSANLLLNIVTDVLRRGCPNLTFNAFKRERGREGAFCHCVPRKTSQLRVESELVEVEGVIVGRNLRQWDEVKAPEVPEIRLTQVWRQGGEGEGEGGGGVRVWLCAGI